MAFIGEDDEIGLGYTLVVSGGKLPHSFLVQTSKLLDVILVLSPKCQGLTSAKKKSFKKTLRDKLYNRTRPGFYSELDPSFHIGYAGQPGGTGTQHHWNIFCDDALKLRIESIIAGSAITATQSKSESNGNYTKEWFGLYLRSEAEVKIAEALNRAGVLFFANARGRVGLQMSPISNSQHNGLVEVDFMIFHQGKCISLEVDGDHHSAEQQTIRDYARDRALFRSGVPTIRFMASECYSHPQDVVAEILSMLAGQ